MKRYLSLWLPQWPLERHARTSGCALPVEPFALIEAGVHGLELAAVNGAAAGQGLHAGMKFTDARARVPNLVTQDIDRAADTRALEALGAWLVRFSPRVALAGADGLILETTGCAHLYGGEAEMLAALRLRVTRAGYTVRLGLAPTAGAAFALARSPSGQGADICLSEADLREGLAGLPVQTLRLSPEAVTLLRRFGLTRIGQLYTLDRKALARRFQSRDAADAVMLRLDQALGVRAEPLHPLQPAPEHVCHLPCPEPIADTEALTEGLKRLSEALGAELARFGTGARGFRLMAFRADGEVSVAEVSASQAARDPAHIQRLFREKLERIDPGFGIDHLMLEALRPAPMQTGAAALSGTLADAGTDFTALSALADRLTAKLGQGAVTCSIPQESHLPEKAERRAAYDGTLPLIRRSGTHTGPRPARMFLRPERMDVLAEVPDGPPLRFVWRRVARKAVRADGPERIAPDWWTHLCASAARPRARDYYRVEDSDGRRYWIFREGLYEDGRGGAPGWYVHGLFA